MPFHCSSFKFGRKGTIFLPMMNVIPIRMSNFAAENNQ